jgi:hypothetical protein
MGRRFVRADGPTPGWSDEHIVDYIRHWAVERSKCGLDSNRYSQINDQYLGPAIKVLKSGGSASVAKILPLLDDSNSDVRLAAAAIAYELDAAACRRVFDDLMKIPDDVGLMAWATLAAIDHSNTPNPTEIWGSELS